LRRVYWRIPLTPAPPLPGHPAYVARANRPKLSPSWWFALIAVLPACLGVFLFVHFLLNGLTHVTDSLTQVVVPGKSELSLKTPGIYTIFLEEQSVVGGKIYATTESVSGLTCTVTAQADNKTILLRRPGFSSNYTVNGRAGHSVLEFTVDTAGTYLLSCGYSESQNGPETVVAVGSGTSSEIFKTLSKSFLSLFWGFALAGCVVLIIYLARRRTQKKLAAAPAV
jgi:hypothetical protein